VFRNLIMIDIFLHKYKENQIKKIQELEEKIKQLQEEIRILKSYHERIYDL